MIVNGYKICARAYLGAADLSRANLSGAHLSGADLRGAYLHKADLSGAYLRWADLRGANLWGADLRWARLANADLRGADLRWARLANADLRGANLASTVLDPANVPNGPTLDPSAWDGFEVRVVHGRTRVYGWRTHYSQHAGRRGYKPGGRYTAPVFSTCATDCHPGIYFATSEWLDAERYPGDRVRCWAYIEDIHKAGNKYRCRVLHICRNQEG